MTSTYRSHHDVVVVGARCAGAATAMLLARMGHDVVMVDKARLPSDTLSTHGIARGGVVQLARWGLLDDVLASGAPAIEQVTFNLGGESTTRRIKHRAGVDVLVAPRRHVLDGLLADEAVESGADLRTGVTATGVLQSADGRVVGITARTADGDRLELSARFVVGADGLRSRMAEHFGAEVLERFTSACSTYYTYVAGLGSGGFEFHIAPGAFAGVFPTHGGEACVWLCRPTADLGSVRTAGAGRFAAFLKEMELVMPGLGRRVHAGQVTAPVRGVVDLPNHIRRPHGPGWALVGDAGYHRDPITGHGITDAFRDAELLATALDRSIREPAAEGDAMAAYQRTRDAMLRETFDLTRALTGFPPPDRFVALQIQLSEALEREAELLAALPQRMAEVVGSAA
jgi:flavin-dependent dehydrogenase